MKRKTLEQLIKEVMKRLENEYTLYDCYPILSDCPDCVATLAHTFLTQYLEFTNYKNKK